MLAFSRLCTLVTFAALVSGAVVVRQNEIVPPASQGAPAVEVSVPEEGRTTDSGAIVEAAQSVDQKETPGVDELPNQPPPETLPTVVDGRRTGRRTTRRTRTRGSGGGRGGSGGPRNRPRAVEDYVQIFAGTGTGPTDRDASIHGTAYLTYTLVNNATYNVEACLDFCSSVSRCVFANLYYEFNNYGLDFEASEQSNLKCAVYADVHTAAEKTNFGNQQSYPPPAPLIHIQQSGGWALRDLVEPNVPEGYEYVFGPIDFANNAAGYMGFAFLSTYDVDACAHECNQRGADAVGGSCKFFNIWRAVVDGNPTTYTCSMYFQTTDESTATNGGQGSLEVTYSRGYRRINYVIDGGFEGYQDCSDFCFTTSYANWVGTSPPGGTLDATIFHFQPYARTGTGAALLGSATGVDNLQGTMSPAAALNTVAGRQYKIEFYQSSAFSGPTLEAGSRIDVLWNGNLVLELRPGFTQWERHSVDVTAVGGDTLAFYGGAAPAWSFIDDVSAYLL
ncbi:hypothetical protein FA15DRAFT_649239 [Coprinopsis marcescibilis]|uniref:Fruit-body specific protein a n=1 Tax=Coprinopsis marcescibilis TaxID=230819 RepID=A0A5C3KGI9_COPMA|nr:hypothetical protein FA15DRAFT_649239 [Coprinopsis marcescibilis]